MRPKTAVNFGRFLRDKAPTRDPFSNAGCLAHDVRLPRRAERVRVSDTRAGSFRFGLADEYFRPLGD